MWSKAKRSFIVAFMLAFVLFFGYEQSYAEPITHVMEIRNDSSRSTSFRIFGPTADINFSSCASGNKERGPCVIPPRKSSFLTIKREQEKKDKEILYYVMFNDVKSPYKVGELILRINYSQQREFFVVVLGGIYDQVPALSVKAMSYANQPVDFNTQVVITNR